MEDYKRKLLTGRPSREELLARDRERQEEEEKIRQMQEIQERIATFRDEGVFRFALLNTLEDIRNCIEAQALALEGIISSLEAKKPIETKVNIRRTAVEGTKEEAEEEEDNEEDEDLIEEEDEEILKEDAKLKQTQEKHLDRMEEDAKESDNKIKELLKKKDGRKHRI